MLQIFIQSDKALAVKEIADISGMPASKIHHYLVSLVRTRVIHQIADGRYELSSFALHMGLAALRRLEPVELASNAARQLRDTTGEATFISVWGNYGPTIIRYFEGFQPITVEVKAGNVLPLATSASGKVFLTWGHDKLIDPVLSLENLDQQTIEDIRATTRSIKLGRVDSELLPRIASLAAPVFDEDGRLALVITQLGWTGKFDNSERGQIATALRRVADQLSVDLGHTGSANQLWQP